MSPHDLKRQVAEAEERITSADARLGALLTELEVAVRAEKTMVTEAIRAALDDLAAARAALAVLLNARD